MRITILGSGGCTVIPKPLCRCRVCEEARERGVPYERTGPSAFIHEVNMLIDTPAEISMQLNRQQIEKIDYLIFTHADPDHVEGFRVVEQITLDFRSWKAYPEKQIHLLIPGYLRKDIHRLCSVHGPFIDFFETQGFIKTLFFEAHLEIDGIMLTAIPVVRDSAVSSIFVFKEGSRKIVYAPCDVKPFPVKREEVRKPDLLIIQPGIFERGLKHDFIYPEDHISRTTLYTFEESLSLAREIEAERVVFTHLEEYWNRSHDDYLAIQDEYRNIRFAYDGLQLTV
jgi:phosphoribosyl 1,2-cyclic phosphate phosphodiesterase